ncbi:hypothetical protein [Catelliglobosispora koreensis]|uniref:hypothetical protein n=1 Tax=Catelliglobosispora koreensis TaxID=129052 RepID=UPI00038115A2|nr:hypothetical protein [Catelliglobosispora koreensis]
MKRTFGILLAGFLAGRAYVLAHATPFTAYDTSSYTAKVSLIGHAPRTWGVPALYALAGSDWARVCAQWTLGTLAWGVLATVLWHAFRHDIAKISAALAVLLLGLVSPVTSWDFALLSESLSLSLGVLAVALVIHALTAKSSLALWLAAGITVCWVSTRLDIAVFALGLAAVCAVMGRRGWLPAALIVAGVCWSLAIAPAVSDTYRAWAATGLPQTEETFLYRLRLEILPYREMKEAYEKQLGMPVCPGAERVASGPDWAIERFSQEYQACPELQAWARENMTTAGYRIALTHPGLFVKAFARSAAEMMSGPGYGATYAKPVHVIPEALERLIFQPRKAVLPVLLAAMAIAVAAAWRLRMRRSEIIVAGAVAAASMGSAAVTVMHTAGEYSRLGIQEAVLLRLAIILMAVAAVDVFLGRRAHYQPMIKQSRRAVTRGVKIIDAIR